MPAGARFERRCVIGVFWMMAWAVESARPPGRWGHVMYKIAAEGRPDA